MSSVLNVDTIADKAGTGPVALTKQSAAKAFSVINLSSGNTIRKSFNVASITDIGTGTVESNFTNAFSDNDYYELDMADSSVGDYSLGCSGASSYATTAKARSYNVRRDNGSGVDQPKAGALIHGDLA